MRGRQSVTEYLTDRDTNVRDIHVYDEFLPRTVYTANQQRVSFDNDRPPFIGWNYTVAFYIAKWNESDEIADNERFRLSRASSFHDIQIFSEYFPCPAYRSHDTDSQVGKLSSWLHLAADNARVSLHGLVLSKRLSSPPQMLTAAFWSSPRNQSRSELITRDTIARLLISNSQADET